MEIDGNIRKEDRLSSDVTVTPVVIIHTDGQSKVGTDHPATLTSSLLPCDNCMPNQDDQQESQAKGPQLSALGRLSWHLRKREGIFLSLIAAFFFAVSGAFIDAIATTVNPFQLTSMKVPVLVVGTSSLMIAKHMHPPRHLEQYLWLLPSGITLTGLNLFLAFSYKYMAFSDTVSISQLSLILTGVLSWIILKEPFRILDLLLAILAMTGVVLIARPSFIFGTEDNIESNNAILGTVFALGVAVCGALAFVIVRKQSTIGIHPYQSSFANAVVMEILSIILCTTTSQWSCPSKREWWLSQGAGLSYFIGQITLYLGLAREKAAIVSIVFSFQIVFAFILQILVFQMMPLWTSLIGGLLVLIACVGTVMNRQKTSSAGKVNQNTDD
ncbi:solute carrier family 35 member G1-like [Apostichopus japonicus]|uniref:solute carrier family 35 member G1-like n=1 Tax=Stichopus japonicus TaxID=307972 RepID=UPI003AB35D87